MTARLAIGAFAILLSTNLCGQSPAGARSAKCAGPEHRRLDFWVGDWDAYEAGGGAAPVARARIELILGGCAIHELYEQTDGLVGRSFSIYDATRNLWHQTWVTNRGGLLQLDGRFQGGALTLQGVQRSAGGREETVRALWKPEKGGVRETAETSADGGRTWRPLFDIHFRRHAPKPPG